MTTSGVTALTMTAREIIEFALRELNAIPIGQELDVNEVAPVIQKLNVMLRGYETRGPHLWRVADGSVALLPNTPSYSLATDTPLRVIEARYRYANGQDLPMKQMTAVQYKTLPIKLSPGVPTQWYFNPQATSQTLYVWPVPRTITTETIQYSYQRRFQICTTLDDDLDIPSEWLDTVGMSLAARLLASYGVEGESAARIEKTATMLLRSAKAFDRPAFVQFMPDYRVGA